MSNLDTFCSKSQAQFSNLLSLTQIQNNMRIKNNNNNNKKAQLPRQSTQRTRTSPWGTARERVAGCRREPRCPVQGWGPQGDRMRVLRVSPTLCQGLRGW